MKEIKNHYLRVLIDEVGAQVRSVTNLTNGHNYLHDGNPSVWSGVSPILFPAVGKSYNNRFNYQDNQYSMVKHGFARDNKFEQVSHDDMQIEFSFKTNTQSNYPFDLELRVIYRLENNNLITEYKVINHATSKAVFSLGAHPGFNCPFNPKLKLEDYYLEFESNEVLTEHFITQDGYFKLDTSIRKCKQIMLDEHTFDNDALVFSNFKSSYIDLIERNTLAKIRVTISGFNYLGIWAKPGRSNFVCIEPWCGRADDDGYEEDISLKDGVIILAPNGIFDRSYTITFDY